MRRLVATSLAAVWHRWHPSAFRSGSWYWLGAISLTLLWLATVGLAPEAGLARSYWYPVDASTEPVIEERITGRRSGLHRRAQPADPELPGSLARWCGSRREPNALTFMQEPTTASSFEWTATPSWNAIQRWACTRWPETVELAAGAHRLEIDHWQDGGGRSLNVQWAPAGGTPALLSPTRLFPEDPGAIWAYWLRFAAMRLPVLVLLVWATGVA